MFKNRDKETGEMKDKARGKLLEHIRGMAKDAMAGNLEGMKKVTVASPSKEGLKKGLETAEDVLESGRPPKSMMGDSSEEYGSGEDAPSSPREKEQEDLSDMDLMLSKMSYEEKCELRDKLDQKLKEEDDSSSEMA